MEVDSTTVATAAVATTTGKCSRLVILTLKKHRNGIWITRLVERLNGCTQRNHEDGTDADNMDDTTNDNNTKAIHVDVQALEDWLAHGWIVSPKPQNGSCGSQQEESIFDGVVGIVNRVSDAAPPILFKACCAVLQAAEVWGIQVWNGPTSYALCANKWCHHVLFNQAGLESPTTTMKYHVGQTDNDDTPLVDPKYFQEGTEILIKPNAGGFGAGIEKMTVGNDALTSISSFEDNMVLIQAYIPPLNNKLYRVWFLNGKVQCAVERVLEEENTTNNSQFTTGCAGGVCSLPRRAQSSRAGTMQAWKIPYDVQQEIEQRLLPLLEDAHCGSVEFLYDSSNEDPQRLYFDLNLLSTLPIIAQDKEGGAVTDDDKAWAPNYDPWHEMAKAIWTFVRKEKNNGKF